MQQDGGAKPVFVDPSGRRSRHLQRVLWVLAALLGCYLALVVVSLVGAPGLSRLRVPGVGSVLPGPQAPQLGATSGGRRAPARLLPPAVSPSPTHASTSRSGSPSALPSALPSPLPSRAPTPSPLPRPSPSPSAPGLPRATPSTAASPSPVRGSNRASPRSSRAPSAHPSRPPR